MPIDLDGISGGATLLLAMGGHTSCSLSCQFVARRPVTNRAVGRCVRWKILSRRSASKTATALLLNSSSSNNMIDASIVDLAAKGTEALAVGREKAATAYTTVMAQPVVQAATTKSGAVAEQLRAKVDEKGISHTIVIEAAVYILQQKVLQVMCMWMVPSSL